MRILVDMDEVLVDFMGPLINQYNAIYNKSLTREDITGWSLPEGMCEIYKDESRNFFVGLSPLPASRWGMDHISKHDAIIASSPSLEAHIAKQKMIWVENYFPEFPLVLTERKDIFEADVLIDDAIHNLTGFSGWKIVMDRPWNRSYEGAEYRVKGWVGIVKAIREIEGGFA